MLAIIRDVVLRHRRLYHIGIQMA